MRAKLFLGVSLLLTVLLGGYASYTQAARKNAPVFYFKIAPVDPRALLSGDYMSLSYDIENRSDSRENPMLFYAAENGVVQTEKTNQPVKIDYHGWLFNLPPHFYFQEVPGKMF